MWLKHVLQSHTDTSPYDSVFRKHMVIQTHNSYVTVIWAYSLPPPPTLGIAERFSHTRTCLSFK